MSTKRRLNLRWTCRIVVLLIVPTIVAAEAQSPRGATETPPSSMFFQNVHYRTPEKRGKVVVWLASGDLAMGVETISFQSKKITVTIPAASIREVVSERFPDDPINTWVVIKYDEGGSPQAAAFKGAGLGRDTEALHEAAMSTWLIGSPRRPTTPTETEIAAAIDALHTTRLESLSYSNNTVPKNVWRLVFTPGIDDALLRAYRAGDPDGLFRFNIIMILNRRVADLDTEEHRQQIKDFMIGAVRNDSFGWVKVEARDALRRIGVGKEVLQEADALIAGAQGTAAKGDPLGRLAGDWRLTAFVIGSGQFGGPRCGKPGAPGPSSVSIAPPGDGAVSLAVSCDDGSDYNFRLKHNAESNKYLITVKSRVGVSVGDFPVTYVEGQGWKGEGAQQVEGKEVSITATVGPIEGSKWAGWMIAVLPTADIAGGPDDVKTPYFRVDLTRPK